MDNDLKKLLDAIEARPESEGWSVDRTPKNGLPVVYRHGRRITSFAGTPSDVRSWANSIAPLKREGFVLPNQKHTKKKGER